MIIGSWISIAEETGLQECIKVNPSRWHTIGHASRGWAVAGEWRAPVHTPLNIVFSPLLMFIYLFIIFSYYIHFFATVQVIWVWVLWRAVIVVMIVILIGCIPCSWNCDIDGCLVMMVIKIVVMIRLVSMVVVVSIIIWLTTQVYRCL